MKTFINIPISKQKSEQTFKTQTTEEIKADFWIWRYWHVSNKIKMFYYYFLILNTELELT